jgi:hypothetical protein
VRKQDDKFKTQLGTQCESCHRTIRLGGRAGDHGALTSMPPRAPHHRL